MRNSERVAWTCVFAFVVGLATPQLGTALADGVSMIQGIQTATNTATGIRPVVTGLKDTSGNVQQAAGSTSGVPFAALTHTDGTVLTSTTGIKAQLADTTASGSINANGQTVSMACAGLGSVGVDIRGFGTANILSEGSVDGTNFFTVSTWNSSTNTMSQAFSANTSGNVAAVAGLVTYRVRCTSYTSGTMTVTFTGRATSLSGFWAPVFGPALDGSQTSFPPVYVCGKDPSTTTMRAVVCDLPTAVESSSSYHALVKNVPAWGGTQANMWNASAVGVGATSNQLDTTGLRRLDAFGNVSAATTISLQVSQDSVNWYDPVPTTGVNGNSVVLAGAGNFGLSFDCGARYVRLKTSAAATITATVAGKG